MKNMMNSFSFRCTRRLVAALTAGVLLPLAASAPSPAIAAGEKILMGAVWSPPAELSTTGDFATDILGNPWDFSENGSTPNNEQDVIPYQDAGLYGVPQPTITLGGGVLSYQSSEGDHARLLMEWPMVLPWGHDGWAHPIDGSRYSRTSVRLNSSAAITMAFRFWTAADSDKATPTGMAYFDIAPGWGTYDVDMLDRARYRNGTVPGPWGGPITRFELVHERGANQVANVQIDWVRVRRADAPVAPPAGVPVLRVISPSEQGGADYATEVRGNPWDFAGLDDIGSTVQVSGARIEGDGMVGVTTGNDSSMMLPIAAPINGRKYHRLSIDVCYDGPFGLSGDPGGGMNGRLYWGTGQAPDNSSSVSQDFVVFPGCQVITIDLTTNPRTAVNETGTVDSGWDKATYFRFDFHEDPGMRNIRINDMKLSDDAVLRTAAPIVFDVAEATGTADIYVSSQQGSYTGTRVATVAAIGGRNTFTWNGTDAAGNLVPNGTYWVWIAVRSAGGISSSFASGPLRLQKPVPDTPSYYVPLTPTRLLDTRTGQGGYSSPLGAGEIAQLDVTGVGGVPDAGVTAVVLNVTVDAPWTEGILSVFPSEEPRPLVSNLNFNPGQTVPNLVTVKVGANGAVDIFNSGLATHVIADVAGYYTSAPQNSGRFTALTPARLLDTRDGTGRGGAVGPIGSGQSIDVSVLGVGGVPTSGVSSVALNVTVDAPTASGFFTVWPTGEPRPTASTHNFVPGQTIANSVIAKVGANGRISIYNYTGNADAVADVIGYFSARGGLFVPIAPQRIADSRDGFGLATLQQAAPQTLAVATGSPVPTTAAAVVANVTSVNSSLPSFVTAWPSGLPMPLASTVNPRPGIAVPNQAYLQLGSNGSLGGFNASGSTDLIVDVFGYITR